LEILVRGTTTFVHFTTLEYFGDRASLAVYDMYVHRLVWYQHPLLVQVRRLVFLWHNG